MFDALHEVQSTQMIVRTGKVRLNDVVVEQVASGTHPYREVVVTEHPVTGEIFYQGQWVPVRYITGRDRLTDRTVRYTGTEFGTWQIVRPLNSTITLAR